MPWPFGTDDAGGDSGAAEGASLNRHGRRLKWRGQKGKAKREAAPKAKPPATPPVLFEAYEPRLLLSGAPVGTVLASSTTAADFLDADGTKVTATLTGPGQWQFVQGTALPTLIITGTNATSTFSIAGVGGDGRVALEGVTLAGPMAAFGAPTTDPVSTFSIGGAVQTIVLGNVRDMVLSSTAAIGEISVQGWQGNGVVANGISAPSVGTLASAGQLNLSMTLSGLGQALGSVLAGGALSGGLWQVAGDVGSIGARAIGAGWAADVAGAVGVVQTSGAFSGTLATQSLDVMSIGGSFLGGQLMVGANLGGNGRLGGSGFDADTFGAGYIGQLRVAGAMIGARVHVGVDPVNGVYDDGDDRIVGGAASRIQTLIVGGRIDSTSRIVTGVLPPSFFAAGKAYTPATTPRRVGTVPGDSMRPELMAALVNDTGPSATDGVTSEPAMRGTALDAGGIVVLSGGLDVTPAGQFTDLINLLDFNGGFTLGAADLASLAGGTLSEGPHVLHLLAVDKAGNARSLDIKFTYSNTQIAVALANDTGRSATDGVSTDYAVAGKVAGGTAIAKASVGLDGPAGTALTLAGDGGFTLSKAQIDALAGGALKEGAHVLRVAVEDANGIATTREMAFTYDITAPGVGSFGLTPSSDTGTVGDGITAAARVGLVGVTEAGAVATLGGGTALAAANGGFQFADVVLANGVNKLSVQVADIAGNASTMQISVERSGTVATDVALAWNQATLEAVRKSSLYPETATRIMAMVGIAQFDTLAAIEGTAAFLVGRAHSGPIDTEYALAVAAHRVLHAAFPSQRGSIDAVLAPFALAVADGAAKTNGQALGGQIADAVLAIRAADGSANYVEYLASKTPGKWRPTAPSFEVAEEPQWAELVPFAMASPDQFQSPPPPDMDSAAYAAALAEVKALGSASSATRTADQGAQAQFWADGRGSYTPPGHWNQIAQQIAQAQGNSLAANVRLFAQLNVALADTAIASWNTKYAYSLWRPIDAIQQADLDGNDATEKNAAWQPLLITPPHPEYVSGHSSFSNAAASVLQAVFGNVAFTTSSYTLPGVTRDFTTFQQAADEAGRSRIFGGIHFEFSNVAGKTLGQHVAAAALARFELSQDTRGPSVVASLLPGVSKGNVTLTGQVTDNLSGVAEARISIDGAASAPLTLDADGRYSITTGFVLDGSADALHSITITAKDAAGNAAAVTRNFRLDTRLPLVVLTSIAEGDTLTFASRLAGVASPTGSTLSTLSYSFNGGPANSIFFDSAVGSFDSAINLAGLDIGTHTLTLRASDAAGNVATLSRQVTLAALPPFFLSAIGPGEGEVNIGTTERPEVRFSRAVKLDSLTAESFYATTANGTKLAATIVPAQDGSYANLFFAAPMPGGTQITLNVDGNKIRAAADGAFLDANLDGAAGGMRTVTFTTVSLTPVAGTTLKGRVVDPGPDLQPMTFDDMRRGPDGVAYTGDDLFLNPIAHAKVYLLGFEGPAVFTDANGEFTLTNLPSGNVKVAVDGRTATNAPAGVFWPEMVMDSELRPGMANTVMDTMGSAAERLSHAGRLEIYLPRVQATIFSVISSTGPTTVGVDAGSAPNLTDSQRAAMSVTVDPGSVIGEEGKPLTNAQIGISTVPPELVRDMLPPGVLQHTFDITIQAPGAATFTTPATISFPNVFGAAPGTKLNILSFDHTTGMLVINGTATVSEDGKSVVSDEGAGPRAPGWHGITPPGGCNPAGGAPPDPVPPSKAEKVTEHAPVALTFLTEDKAADNFKAFSWTAPAANKALPPLPPIPGCEVPPHNPDTKTQPFISVTIEVDGALGSFAKPVNGSLNLQSQSFTLSAGTGIQKKFDFDPKTYAEMFTTGQGFADLNRDRLYGAKIKITEIKQNSDGSRTRDIYTYYENRFVSLVHAPSAVDRKGDAMAFFRTNTDGVVRTNNVDLFLPNTVKTSFTGGGAPFTLAGSFGGNGTLNGQFDPDKAGDDQKAAFTIQVSDAKGPLNVGSVTAIGTATAPTKISVDEAGYRTELSRALKAVSLVTEAGKDGKLGTADDTKTYYYDYGGGVTVTTLDGPDGKAGTADDVTLNTVAAANQLGNTGPSFLAEFKNFLPDVNYTAKAFDAMLTTQVAAMKAAVVEDYKGAGKQFQVVAANAGADVTMSWQDTFFNGSLVYGFADFDRATKYQAFYLAKRGADGKGTIGQSALEWAIAEGFNLKQVNSGQFGVAINFDWTSGATFAQYVANTVSHELAHTFGLNDAYVNIKGKGSPPVNPPNDIMRSGNVADGNLAFAATNNAQLQAALGIQPAGDTPITAAVKEYRANFNLPGSVKGLRDFDNGITTPYLYASWAGTDVGAGATVSFAATAADGPGGASRTVDVTLSNIGLSTLNLDSITLGDGGKGFSIVGAALKGTTLAVDQTATLTLAFDPAVAGAATDTLTIATNSDTGPLTFTLAGAAISAGPVVQASAENNNFGGQLLGTPAAERAGLFTLSNAGAGALQVTGITLVEGAAEFTLLGVPANLGTTPASLGLGESLSFGISFSPSRLGLQRAVIEVATNDPLRPVLRLGAMGTGVAALPTASWGRDYVGMQVTTPNNPPVLNAVSDDKGFFSFFLPSDSPYHMAVFDPATGLVAHDYSRTAQSGKGVNLTATLVFGASVERDGDFDGLPDDVEFAIGTNPRGTDTDNDGLSDFTEIQQGLDPLGGLNLPVGVVSAASLQGSAEAVAVIGSLADPTKLTAFLATGSAGLAVVDVSDFQAPTVLAELDLAGTNTRVAVDGVRGIALLAAGAGGLHFVNISTPASPTLIRTESFTDPVVAVALRDGTAFVAAGTKLMMLDVATGELRQTVDLAGATLRDVVVAGNRLYTLDSAHAVRVLSVLDDVVVPQGSVTLPAGGSRLAAGAGVVFVAASTGGTGGFLTVNVSDPNAPVLISGVDDNSLAGTAMALNGSGLGLVAGGIEFVFGGFKGVDLVDVTDTANTGVFLQRFNLPQLARDITIANGVAFVADGSAGLQVLNYRAFDTKGQAPTVTIGVGAIDMDPGKAGVQVVEGRSLEVVAQVSDDVQVRNVELLVNGKVVLNDPTFPFELFADVPSIKAGGTSMTVQVRTTDTGGNTTLSGLVTIDVVPDTFAPGITSVSIAEGAKRFFVRGIDVMFNEAIDPVTINGAAVTLVRAGIDGLLGTADDVAVPVKLDTRAQNHVLSVAPSGSLLPGDYRFTLGAGAVADVAGNALASPLMRNFTVRPASSVKAAIGAPAESVAPSANPGQTIGISVPFDPTTARMTFATITSSGTPESTTVLVSRADAALGIAYFNVPFAAITGDATVFSQVGNTKTGFDDGLFPLQVVPVVTSAQIDSVSGGMMNVTLRGLGFVEANGSKYQFGTELVTDVAANSGPDVYAAYPNYDANSGVSIQVPLSDGAFGPITVKTAGGTSLGFTTELSGITATAMRGTPANPALASANPGQAVTLTGSGFAADTGVIFSYRESSGGALTFLRATPTTVSSDGTRATVIVPTQANGVFSVRVLGGAAAPLLQIVPTLQSFSTSGNTLYLSGSGLVEGASTFLLAGATVADTATNQTPDIYYTSFDNGGANLPMPAFGLGGIAVTTAGGTSTTLPANMMHPAQGLLRDVAVAPTTGDLWVAGSASPLNLYRIDPATGATTRTITLDSKAIGSSSFTGGLQVTSAAFTLGGTSVPAGSLLVFNANLNPDRVVAIDLATEAVIATLALGTNYDTSGGAFDPQTGDLFLIDRAVNPGRLVRLNAATGAEVSSAVLPANFSEGGLAIAPASGQAQQGNLWYVTGNENTAFELSRSGEVLRRVGLDLQGMAGDSATGVAFRADGTMLVSTSNGRVFAINPQFDPAQAIPVLTSIVGTATRGTPGSAGQASANAGQVIELVGANFGSGTQVLFPMRDFSGVTSIAAVAPNIVSADGTRLQVKVPEQARTGDIRVSNIGRQNLGGVGHTDSIYRALTVQFTAGAASAQVRFADGGLEGVDNESWGLDNVVVRQGGTTIFSDTFESGTAAAGWSDSRVDSGSQTYLSRFSGRFASGEQQLSLSGLTAGQTYTLSFDLYALDSWDGASAGAGPDQFQVRVDGALVLNETISNYSITSPQSIGNSAGVRLQVVPTVTGLTGQPGLDSPLTIDGSGFQEGATTFTIGGVAVVDEYTNLDYPNTYDYYYSNTQYQLVVPRVLDGPVRVATEGGFDEIAGPSFFRQAGATFSGITALGVVGTPSQLGQVAANVGQTITLNGSGFTYQTMVQFDAADDTGRLGTVTRRVESATGNGTSASLVVPALARTGSVRVLGAEGAQTLQIVPTLRAVGGIVAPGNTLLIEATGLVQPELVVQVDNRAIGTFTLTTVADGTGQGGSYLAQQSTQQLLSLVLPSGVANGVITVSTVGGSATLRTGQAMGNTLQTPAADIGDTMTTAAVLNLGAAQSVTVNAQIGDGAFTTKDVDMFRVEAQSGERLILRLSEVTQNAARIRVFDGTGASLATYAFSSQFANNTWSFGPYEFSVPATGTYYLGVTSGNASYDPAVGGSGTASIAIGYHFKVQRVTTADTSLTAIQASALRGTAAQTGVAAANVGQTITLLGIGLAATDAVVFTTIDSGGTYSTQTAVPLSVAANGSSLTVRVPEAATTGRVRLEREVVGILLQVVPTLDSLDMTANQPFNNSTLRLYGTGFAEGSSAVMFGTSVLRDVSRTYGTNTNDHYTTQYIANGLLSTQVPNGVPTGPLRVVTAGGTSDTLSIGFAGITSAAGSGTPSNPGVASANPGQSIEIQGTNLTAVASIVFSTIDENGVLGQKIVRPWAVNAAGTAAQVVVPIDAMTGVVRVVGDQTAAARMLQIVPVVRGIDVTYVQSPTGYIDVTVLGGGLVEGNNSEYRFGTTTVTDGNSSVGPNVSYDYSNSVQSGMATLRLPLSGDAFGPVTVTTTGGTSAPFSLTFAGVTGTAFTGKAADTGLASANPGQVVKLTGAGLSTATDVLARYTRENGDVGLALLIPTSAAADGTSALLQLPFTLNGVVQLQMPGTNASHVVQIVPTLVSSSDGGGVIYLQGAGFVEGKSTITFAGATVVDTQLNTGPNVWYGDLGENGRLDVTEPTHGVGNVTVSTAGGTSAPMALSQAMLPYGFLQDIAFDPATGDAWVVDNANPGSLRRVDLDTGAMQAEIVVTNAVFGTTYYWGGLQVAPQAFSLNGVNVPAGSLLGFNGQTNPDRVVAVNPGTGALIASLVLAANYDTPAGVFHPGSGHLFVLDRRTGPHQIVEINPADGTVLATFAAPFNASYAGMAIDPVTGNIWFGSNEQNTVVEITAAGQVVRSTNFTAQGGESGSISGLTFDAAGRLLVASTSGRIHVIRTDADFAIARPVLGAIIASPHAGVPANKVQGAANVGQVVELEGLNFGATTRVLFPTRDSNGTESLHFATPLMVSGDGTRLQVVVPNTATTGDVKVVNSASQNFGFSGWADGIYRNVQLSFKADDATTVLRFADSGIEDVSNESWGLDNVAVSSTGGTVFSDTFEGKAQSAWSDARIDGVAGTVFTRFSGRFANEAQTLTLGGLTAGQTYTLSFDLYALDSWDGRDGSDMFQVSADGVVLLRDTIANHAPNQGQTFNASGGVPLLVVPTLTGTSGRPGGQSSFTLQGTGFMEGETKFTVGGTAFADTSNDPYLFEAYGTRNDTYAVTFPVVLDGKIRVTTAGGHAEIAGPTLPAPTPSLFTSIRAPSLAGGLANNAGVAANAGQTIVLLGQGFTSSTLVQFEGTDDQGVSGVITRGGQVNNAGTELSVQVPALARTGMVTVRGAAGGNSLAVVPLLRGAGGTTTAGNVVLIDGTGLPVSELQVTVGGKVAPFSMRTITDGGAFGFSLLDDDSVQQLLTVTVPAGAVGSDISVVTNGGTATLKVGTTTTLSPISAANDVGDTLATAQVVTLAGGERVTVGSTSGDGPTPDIDVDLYRVSLATGDQLQVFLEQGSYFHLRVFDEAGVQKAAQTIYSSGGASAGMEYRSPGVGTYYVGISGYANQTYNPTITASGTTGYNTGKYAVSMTRAQPGVTRLTGIAAAADLGTPAAATVASANPDQTITLTGTGLLANERVVFTTMDANSPMATVTVMPISVAADGTSLTVKVPHQAATGTVRLERDTAGVMLQVVPVLLDVTGNAGGPYAGGSLTLTGRGFIEARSTIHLGDVDVVDISRNNGPSVGGANIGGQYVQNGSFSLQAPGGAKAGPLSVTTVGGTSNVLNLSFTGLTATAASGTPADAAKASANPGQTITLQGDKFDTSLDVVFDTRRSDGTVTQMVVRPASVAADGMSATVVVPTDAVTGRVRVISDKTATEAALQIVPLLTNAQIEYVTGTALVMGVRLTGRGFVEGPGSSYIFGTMVIEDISNGAGPDVQDTYDPNYTYNGSAYLNVTYSNSSFGPITVRTEGGTSAPFSVGLSGITATATSGTPANPSEASANPGQSITLTGTGLSATIDILLHYRESGSGALRAVHVSPTSVAADGTSAILALPGYVNGAVRLQVLGSSALPLLQIVPVINSWDVSGSNLYIYGGGFVEGGSTIGFAGATVVDNSPDSTIDIYYQAAADNTGLRLTEPVHGFGPLTITTAGGTSAPVVLNEMTLPYGHLRDVAFNRTTSMLWVGETQNPSKLRRVDPATGAELQTIDFANATLGSTYFWGGLQSVPVAFNLNSVAVPAGSLLVFNGVTNPDRVVALDPATGTVIASLALAANYDLVAGVFHPGTGDLFVTDRRTGPHKIVRISTATGAEVSSFTAPVDAGNGGLAVDPLTGNLWYGADNSQTLYEITIAGGAVRSIATPALGINQNEISGLAFENDTTILVSSTQGRVYRITV